MTLKEKKTKLSFIDKLKETKDLNPENSLLPEIYYKDLFLDSLKNNGVYFNNTFSPADGTIISLNCLFNSRFQYETGIRAKKIILLENNHLQKLKELNYPNLYYQNN